MAKKQTKKVSSASCAAAARPSAPLVCRLCSDGGKTRPDPAAWASKDEGQPASKASKKEKCVCQEIWFLDLIPIPTSTMSSEDVNGLKARIAELEDLLKVRQGDG